MRDGNNASCAGPRAFSLVVSLPMRDGNHAGEEYLVDYLGLLAYL